MKRKKSQRMEIGGLGVPYISEMLSRYTHPGCRVKVSHDADRISFQCFGIDGRLLADYLHMPDGHMYRVA